MKNWRNLTGILVCGFIDDNDNCLFLHERKVLKYQKRKENPNLFHINLLPKHVESNLHKGPYFNEIT